MNDDQGYKRDDNHEAGSTTEGARNIKSGNQDLVDKGPRSGRDYL